MHYVLLLDNNYVALAIIPGRKAIKLLTNEKVEPVHITSNPDKILYGKGWFIMPSIIRLLTKIPWRAHSARIAFSRKNLLLRDDCRCQYCGIKISKNIATIDHVIPRSRNGTTDFSNCVICCKKCNGIKANRTPEEAGMRLIKKPATLSFFSLYKNYIDAAADEWANYIGS
ncbi:MAG: HNH endonuclease [Patescibacteria group bacterium]